MSLVILQIIYFFQKGGKSHFFVCECKLNNLFPLAKNMFVCFIALLFGNAEP